MSVCKCRRFERSVKAPLLALASHSDSGCIAWAIGGSIGLSNARFFPLVAMRVRHSDGGTGSIIDVGLSCAPTGSRTAATGQKQGLEVSDNHVCLIWAPDFAVRSQTKPHSPLVTRTPWRVTYRRLGGQAGMPQHPRADQGKTGRHEQSSVLVLTLYFVLSSMHPRPDSADNHRA
jgi:hypothetical protein